MSDASLVSFLQSELLLLSNEIKKKYPEIKESIENIFQLIRKIKDDPDRPNAVEVFAQTEIILQPIVLSSRTGNSRVIAIAINCLQKLVIFKAFPRECIGHVFTVLETAAEMNSDIQLKSLQCLSPLMANYNDLYGSELIRIFSIAFKLQESKTGMVNNATAAIIRQMIISLFEWVGEEASTSQIDAAGSNFEPSHAQDALLILSDVICRLDDGKYEALDLSKVDKPFALDLIESVIVNHGDVIRAHKAFSALIQDRICPYLIESLKHFNDGKVDFAKSCRHWRIIQFLITEFNDLFPDETEIFIAFGIRILRESNLNWECAMVLELTKSIFQSQNLIEEIYLICEKKESPRIFKDMIEVMLEIMKKVLDSHPSDSQGQIADALGKSSVLTQFDKASPPAVSPIALLLLAYDAFNGWFINLTSVINSACTEKSSLGHLVYKSSQSCSLNPKTATIITDLIHFSGGPLCQTMERVFVELCFNQAQLHNSTIDFFARALKIFSVFEFRSQLRQLSEILLRLSSPENGKDLKKNNLLIIQMMLETGLGIGELLEDSLISIVRVIQITEQLQNQKTRKQQVQGVLQHPSVAFEEDVLAKAIDHTVIFTESTVIWNEKSFTFFIQAYSQFIDELINNFYSDEKAASALLLVLAKLKRLTALNMSRFVEGEKCSVSWELLMAELGKPMQLKDSSLRQSSIETVSMIVDLFIKCVPPSKMKSSRSQPSDSPSDNLQMRVLSPMCKFASTVPWIDVQKILSDTLIRYLNVFGECLTETSWSLVWSILNEDLKMIRNDTGSESSESLIALYQKVHDIVKITSGDFLAAIPMSCLATLIDIISEIGKICLPGELNIPLNTVRYLWDISDFLCSKSVKESFNLWTGLLKHLTRLSLDSRPELRNSAVQTLLRTINMNGNSLKGHADKWTCLFDEIIFEFLKDLRQTSASSKSKNSETIIIGFAHFSRDSESKQWDETESTVMVGVTTLILTHFKGTLYELPDFPNYWRRFLKILKEYAILKDGSVELTGISINCLYQFSSGLKEIQADHEIDDYAKSLWEIWISIGNEGFNSKKTIGCIYFTQDSLLKFFKMFSNLFSLCKSDIKWLESSLKVLTCAVQCLTPSDQVRDIESATEVQKFLVNQVLSELIEKGLGKVLILAEISNWLRLTTNSPKIGNSSVGPEMISMGYASLRSRQSTASSAKVSEDGDSANDQPALIKYTFIAMTSLLLERIPAIITAWKEESELYKSDCLIALIQSLGRFMKLKYKCPVNSKMNPIWKTSTTVFVSILKEMFTTENADLTNLWPVIMEELKGTLHSCKEMFKRSLKQEEMEEDEKFDCQLIDLIADSMISRALKDEKSEIVNVSIDLILQVARITKFSGESGGADDFLFPSGVKALPVSVKEILSFSAYKSLFRLARQGNAESVVANILERIKNLIQLHLNAFQTDRQIFGNDFPFPRLRDLELHQLLLGLINLQARNQLKQVYDLIVKCADFGGGGCDGARMIVKDCRRVLLLLSDKSEQTDFEDEQFEFEFEMSENETVEEEENLQESSIQDFINSKTSLVICEETRSTPSSHRTSPKTISSRRSVSEELFDHLTHDLRIMEISQDETMIEAKFD